MRATPRSCREGYRGRKPCQFVTCGHGRRPKTVAGLEARYRAVGIGRRSKGHAGNRYAGIGHAHNPECSYAKSCTVPVLPGSHAPPARHDATRRPRTGQARPAQAVFLYSRPSFGCFPCKHQIVLPKSRISLWGSQGFCGGFCGGSLRGVAGVCWSGNQFGPACERENIPL